MTIRMCHLSCVFINIFCIGMANVIQSFKMDLYLLISVRITRKIISTTAFLLSILFNVFVKILLKEKGKNVQDPEKYQSVVMTACALLNMMALAMCLLVILRNIVFYLRKHFFTFWENMCYYLLRKRPTVTPIVSIEMEIISEQNNTIGNNICISLDIKEYIRLVALGESLDSK